MLRDIIRIYQVSPTPSEFRTLSIIYHPLGISRAIPRYCEDVPDQPKYYGDQNFGSTLAAILFFSVLTNAVLQSSIGRLQILIGCTNYPGTHFIECIFAGNSSVMKTNITYNTIGSVKSTRSKGIVENCMVVLSCPKYAGAQACLWL